MEYKQKIFNFALIGAAGYVAPRHMKAIQQTGNYLCCALDPNDSVGILDSYFPEADFFLEFEHFDSYLDKQRCESKPIDYVSICSPNYLHDAHIRYALRNDAHAICEKPLVLNPSNVDVLVDIEKESQKRIYTILQLRLHPVIKTFRDDIYNNVKNTKVDVDLSYITSRGQWYFASWKGNIEKSGGIASNIGIHLFDMLTWVFGERQDSKVHLLRHDAAAGLLEFEKARVRWFLSLDGNHLPEQAVTQGKRTYRSITVSGKELEFSNGFTDLHTESYADILSGGGFGLEDARSSIETVYEIQNSSLHALNSDYHPMCSVIKDGY